MQLPGNCCPCRRQGTRLSCLQWLCKCSAMQMHVRLCHTCRASPVVQDRADAVARKVLRLLETGHKELVVALNNALIKEGRFEPAVKMAGEWRTDGYTGARVLYLTTRGPCLTRGTSAWPSA